MYRICHDLKKIPSDVIGPKLIEYKKWLGQSLRCSFAIKIFLVHGVKIVTGFKRIYIKILPGVLFIERSLIMFWSTESSAFPSQLSTSCTRWTGCLVLCIPLKHISFCLCTFKP